MDFGESLVATVALLNLLFEGAFVDFVQEVTHTEVSIVYGRCYLTNDFVFNVTRRLVDTFPYLISCHL